MRSLLSQAWEWLMDALSEPGPRRSVTMAVGLLGAGLLFGLVAVPSPTRLEPPQAVSEPVVTTAFVCPDFRGSSKGLRTTVIATAPRAITGNRAKGTAGLKYIRSSQSPRSLVRFNAKSGSAIALETSRTRGALVGIARAGLAPGFSGGQLSVQTSGVSRAMTGVHCADVGSQKWFVGGGATNGQRTFLFLSNAENRRATVDVDFYGPNGPIDTPSSRGIVVAARSTRSVAIDRLVPGVARLAMRVSVTSGRLGLAIRSSDRRGSVPLGSDFIPESVAPAQTVVIPALPAGAGTRSLLIVAPGNEDADVQIKVIGADGTFSPSGASRVTVGARSVRRVDLSAILSRESSGLLIQSDRPVTAGVNVRLKPRRDGSTDYAWSAATPAISTIAVEPVSRRGNGFNAILIASAPQGAGQLELTYTSLGGAVRKRIIAVGAGRTVSVAMGFGLGSAWFTTSVRALPGSGPVYAGRLQTLKTTRGALFTISPLRDARINVDVPQALPDLSAAVPSAF